MIKMIGTIALAGIMATAAPAIAAKSVSYETIRPNYETIRPNVVGYETIRPNVVGYETIRPNSFS